MKEYSDDRLTRLARKIWATNHVEPRVLAVYFVPGVVGGDWSAEIKVGQRTIAFALGRSPQSTARKAYQKLIGKE